VRERMRFVLDYEEGLFEMRELAMQYGISRKTAYKWLERWEAEGVEGMGDRPPVAARVANRTEAELEGWFVEQRRCHESWGPKKLLVGSRINPPEVSHADSRCGGAEIPDSEVWLAGAT